MGDLKRKQKKGEKRKTKNKYIACQAFLQVFLKLFVIKL